MDILSEIKDLEAIWSSNKPEEYSCLTWEKEQFDKIVQSPLFKTVFPEKEIDRKFRKLLKPFIFDEGHKTIYCKYNGICFESERHTYIFSALTKEMIDVDKKFFGSNTILNSALGLIYKPYTYELSFEEGLPNSFYEEYKEDTWYEVTVRKYKEKEEGKLYGRLSYGASPLDFQAIEAKWGKAVDDTDLPQDLLTQDQINSYYNNQKAGVADGVIKWLFENNVRRYLFVCRVGQANAILGINENVNDKRYFAYDVGLPNDDHIVWNKGSIDRKTTGLYDEDVLAKFNPNVVFLSHWHTDHYKGAFIMPRSVYIGQTAAMWIAPCYTLSNKLNNANRLVGYLMKTGHIAFVDDDYKNTNYNVSLYRVKSGVSNDLNNDCIILQLNKTLLPGDCYYDYWPAEYGKVKQGVNRLSNQMENVVITHHGSSGSRSGESEEKLKKLFKKSPAKAYVCVGENPWKHPNGAVIDMFKDPSHLGFHDVISTKDDTRKITEFIVADL